MAGRASGIVPSGSGVADGKAAGVGEAAGESAGEGEGLGRTKGATVGRGDGVGMGVKIGRAAGLGSGVGDCDHAVGAAARKRIASQLTCRRGRRLPEETVGDFRLCRDM